MTLRIYLTGIALATILAFFSFFLSTWLFSPENADAPVISLVFFSLFIWLAGFFSLIGFFIRKKRFKQVAPFRFLGISFRQGTLLSFLLAGSLFFKSFRIFWPWSGLILLALVFLIEFYGQAKSND